MWYNVMFICVGMPGFGPIGPSTAARTQVGIPARRHLASRFSCGQPLASRPERPINPSGLMAVPRFQYCCRQPWNESLLAQSGLIASFVDILVLMFMRQFHRETVTRSCSKYSGVSSGSDCKWESCETGIGSSDLSPFIKPASIRADVVRRQITMIIAMTHCRLCTTS